MSTLTTSTAWLSLQDHQPVMAKQDLRELFAQDSQRFKSFSLKFNDILMDYSKHPINQNTINFNLNSYYIFINIYKNIIQINIVFD